MFMVLWSPTSGIVAKAVRLPVNARSLKGTQMRSRPLWMEKMNVEAAGWKSEFYAFRYRGQWHLCSVFGHHDPIRSIPDGDDAQRSAEMWVMSKERRARDVPVS